MIGKNPRTLLGHLSVPTPGPDPDPAGQGIGLNELQLDSRNIPVTTPFVDLATVWSPTRIKSLLVVTSGLAWVTAGQAVLQLFASRTAKATRTGAVSQITGPDESLVGPVVSLGPAGAVSLANAAWWFTEASTPGLQWPLAFLGVELVFPSAPTAGLLSVYCYGQAA